MKYIKIILLSIFLSLITYKLLIDEAPQGISISNMPSFSPATQHVKYKFLINRSLAGNPEKLEALTEFWCGGGAGCYDHGWVLLQILIKVGDLNFSKMVENFNDKNKYLLLDFLFVGGEYGPHKDHYYLEKNYPITTRALVSYKRENRQNLESIAKAKLPNEASEVVYTTSAMAWNQTQPVTLAFYQYPVTFAHHSKHYDDDPNESEVLGTLLMETGASTYRKFIIDGYGPEGANAMINHAFFAEVNEKHEEKLFVMVSWQANNGSIYRTFVYDKPKLDSAARKLLQNKPLSKLFAYECDHCETAPNKPAKYKSPQQIKGMLKQHTFNTAN